ncbi:Neurotransmitter-gated ion-channel transmembrane region [Halocaridina rubra]|uniref:Neurotransmitter-gated ion-channel transmembrane region n=1 Tax=Halocaridina rubra TaxID=373956 RepID=A0AAN8X792_HALRR
MMYLGKNGFFSRIQTNSTIKEKMPETARIFIFVKINYRILDCHGKTGHNDCRLQIERNDSKVFSITISQNLNTILAYFDSAYIYHRADTSYESSQIHTNIIVDYSGECKLLIHAVYTSVCDIDIQWFPFDQQTCDMVFASWTADVHQMVLEQGPSDITRFHPNHEFFLENFYSEQFNDFNPCCVEPFSMISYHIQLQRRVKFAMFFFIVPGVLINICGQNLDSFAALLVFSLPAETGEKVGLGINSMLAMMVFLMAMTENLPPTETLPLAGMARDNAVSLYQVTVYVSLLLSKPEFVKVLFYHSLHKYNNVLTKPFELTGVTYPSKNPITLSSLSPNGV